VSTPAHLKQFIWNKAGTQGSGNNYLFLPAGFDRIGFFLCHASIVFNQQVFLGGQKPPVHATDFPGNL
jgi:hypothetical protein